MRDNVTNLRAATPSRRTETVVRPAARTGLLACFILAVLLVNMDVVRGLGELAAADPAASHVVVIPLIALALIARRRESVLAVVRFSCAAGLTIVLIGSASLVLVRRALDVQPATMTWFTAPLVVLCIGGFVLFYGSRAFRAARFPLLFLGFAIPIPAIVLDVVVRALTIGSSEMVAWLFGLTGTPFYRETFTFWLPSLTIHIGSECSGIRSTIALFLACLLAGHLSFKRSWTAGLLLIAVLPVTILKNAVRIVTLSLLTIHVDPAFLQGRLHHDGGVVFFVLALAALAPVFVLLRRAEDLRLAHAGGMSPPL